MKEVLCRKAENVRHEFSLSHYPRKSLSSKFRQSGDSREAYKHARKLVRPSARHLSIFPRPFWPPTHLSLENPMFSIFQLSKKINFGGRRQKPSRKRHFFRAFFQACFEAYRRRARFARKFLSKMSCQGQIDPWKSALKKPRAKTPRRKEEKGIAYQLIVANLSIE